MMKTQFHRRKPTRLKGYDYSLPGAYFVTICVHEKACSLGKIEDDIALLSHEGKIALAAWDDRQIIIPIFQ